MRLNVGAHGFIPVDGYGRLSLGMIKALIYAGHDVYPFELRSVDDKPAWFIRAQGLDFSYLTLQLAPPCEFQHLPGRSACLTMHESTNLPEDWFSHINEKNQLCIVPSPWLIEVMEDAGVKLPIEVVPGGIDPEETPILRRSNNGPYTFGCLADRGSRKGHDLVYSAFYKAFDVHNRDVRLIMKCRPGSLQRLDFSYSRDPRLTIWRADVKSVSDIYAQFDAFMFPTRCEGLGMPCRESAACGVPTVVTRWSGTADDTDSWAMPLEKFKLRDSRMEGCGGLWAEPDMDEIVEMMRWLFEHQDEAKQQALKAAQWMRDNYTYAHAAQKLLAVLGQHFGGMPVPEQVAELPKPRTNGKVHKKVLAQP